MFYCWGRFWFCKRLILFLPFPHFGIPVNISTKKAKNTTSICIETKRRYSRWINADKFIINAASPLIMNKQEITLRFSSWKHRRLLPFNNFPNIPFAPDVLCIPHIYNITNLDLCNFSLFHSVFIFLPSSFIGFFKNFVPWVLGQQVCKVINLNWWKAFLISYVFPAYRASLS